jgi:hypothetical protein
MGRAEAEIATRRCRSEYCIVENDQAVFERLWTSNYLIRRSASEDIESLKGWGINENDAYDQAMPDRDCGSKSHSRLLAGEAIACSRGTSMTLRLAKDQAMFAK